MGQVWQSRRRNSCVLLFLVLTIIRLHNVNLGSKVNFFFHFHLKKKYDKFMMWLMMFCTKQMSLYMICLTRAFPLQHNTFGANNAQKPVTHLTFINRKAAPVIWITLWLSVKPVISYQLTGIAIDWYCTHGNASILDIRHVTGNWDYTGVELVKHAVRTWFIFKTNSASVFTPSSSIDNWHDKGRTETEEFRFGN